ncbi:MAG TPA: GGDEF domain-containing protein [Methylophilus sp.]|nr:GGDEF domain-containing protein [Methylophilus sp.]HQQ32444.1 GGDEF domain-containing protein [Methylophilus sp.]
MPNFDLRTIVFMSMLLTFMFSMMLAITRVHHKEIHGPGYWSVGNLVVGLGMILVLIQLDSSKVLFLPGMALIGTGLSLYINGIQAFTNRIPDHRIPVLVFVLLLGMDAYYMLVQHDVRTMVVLDSAVFALVYLLCARLTTSKDDGLLGTLFWIASSLFLISALVMAARAMLALNADASVFQSLASWSVNANVFLLGAVIQFFISGLFLLMLSYRLTQNMASIALMDGLTGVVNRRGLEDAAHKMQGICKRINLSMTVMMIDIDHFKKVNDQYGHLVGDDMLRHLAKTITGILRSGDVLGRYGGEEFCVCLPNTTEQDAVGLAERIRIGVENAPLLDRRHKIHVTVSIGVADSVRVGYDFKALVHAADNALYQAKNAGRNRVVRASLVTDTQVERRRKH